MKEAAYWHAEKGRVRCDLCPHGCLISEGELGFCGVRGNRNGQLYALTYGLIAAQAIDPVEKKPLYHFYPGHKTLSLGSVGCNLRCRHCQNWRISCCDAATGLHELQALPPEAAVQLALDRQCQSLVWTYNEPSVWYEYILASAPLAHKAGLKTIMVSAGMLNSQPLDDLLPHIDAYRLDIKGFSPDFYPWLTGIDCLEQILENAVAAYKAGCHVEIVTNLIPGHNDDEKQLRDLSCWIVRNLSPETPWHLTAYFPNHDLKLAPTSLDSLEKGVQIGHQSGLAHVFIGNLPGHSAQNSICPGCGQLLIQRNGFRVLSKGTVDGKCPHCGYFLKNYFEA